MLQEVLDSLDSGRQAPVEILYNSLRQIALSEFEVRAWVQVAAQPFLPDRPLSGIPFGVKDIVETRDLVTQYGSPLYEGHHAEQDAQIVTNLRNAGALLLGKTRTTPFASFDPTTTRNPRSAGRTPGGSSSGSAAAVAAGMVPFALGSQTLGSVLRPASYCGICGFKPSFGLIPTNGVLPFAPSLDTVGFFTQTARDMACLWRRGLGGQNHGKVERAAALRVKAEWPMLQAVESAVQQLRGQGLVVDAMDPPAEWQQLGAAAFTINHYEGARSHRQRFERYGKAIGTRLAELVRSGLKIPEAEYSDALECVKRMRVEFTRLFEEYPVILTPAATGAPPEGLATTGDPANNAPWTALGVPAISVPLTVSEAFFGLQMTAAWGRDDALVAMAEQAERLLDPVIK